jgi:hypothetical protein
MSAYIEIQQAGRLLNASVLRLNKLAKRCGIHPSFGGGGTKGNRRHFSVHDVCHLGLAVWLSSAGLRGPAIEDVLRRTGIRTLLANLDTLKKVENEAKRKRFLVATGFRGRDHRYRNIELCGSLKQVQRALQNESGILVPIGGLLDDLAGRLKSLASF